ncbi:hypothetical protein NQ318_004236 [Aromia moschata]|uniref:Integrin beta n=1 Tax=Aromia moschata TaxID=1265417 RepID=A0AAV8Y5I6_9CUCU|nr:hypothetical protein NQ318_004236 [Aromia moschata]
MTFRGVIVLFVILTKAKIGFSSNCTDVGIQGLCLDQETCDDCLQADPCCNWCYDKNYQGRKCNVPSNLYECQGSGRVEVNSVGGMEVPEDGNKEFTDGDAKEIIQIRPQRIDIKLGMDGPVNFTFKYKPAKNYPLELYYLGDLSVSMRENLKIFKTIGMDLSNSLTQLTKNYKLAYGSFLDKIAMPFYFMAPESFYNPCLNLLIDDCEPGYLFKHRLNFTKDAESFAEKVSSSKITANVDDLDGALDAILQILVCGKKMGWTVASRKIILIPTDSFLHSAGDGILAGAVLKPNNTCLIDDEGNHISPLTFDYPSINIIFAVKDEVKIEYYRTLTNELLKDFAFVGELAENSTNILHLISRGYYNFVRQVSFSINTTFAENVDVKFFGDCENTGTLNETSTCNNVEQDAKEFTVQLTLKGKPTKKDDILYIEEKNINEKVALHIKYLGICDCVNYEGEALECTHGTFRCGQCVCDDGWTGEFCDEDCNENDNFDTCRVYVDGIPSSTCYRHGNCICGKCKCDFPYSGKYCEYQCPLHEGAICGGPGHGKCVEGKCECEEGFQDMDCSCSKSTDRCKLFDTMTECNGQGSCVCNTCQCNSGFSGPYCEVYAKNNTLCEDYKGLVEDAVANGTTSGTKDGTNVFITKVTEDEKNRVCGNTTCETMTYVGNTLCSIYFCYNPGQDDAIHLIMTTTCYMTAGFRALTMGAAIFAAIVIGGLLAIICMKYRIFRLEQAEYKKFEDERKNLNELNPHIQGPRHHL